jgi:putative peptidoglycan lipid II flippase
LLIGTGNVTSRVLGLVREQVIAALFGATGGTSAFRTATRVSTAVYDLLLSGATTAALVPVFSDYAASGETAQLSRIVSTFINFTLLGLGAVVAALVIGAPLLVTLLGADPAYFDLAVELTRLALPSILLLGISGILTATLYARQRFTVPAFTAAIYNVGIIFAALTLTRALGIQGLVLGLALGALLQIIAQLPALRGLRYQPVLDFGHPGVRLVARLYTPVFLGMLASYAVVVIDTSLAWRTGTDSVAVMAFATTLIQFPLGLVGAAASLAILPTLSRLATAELDGSVEIGSFEITLLRGLKTVVLLIVPLGALLVVLREPLVAALFQRLAFDAVATQRTALAVLAYSPQLPFVVVDQLLIVAYYARKQTVTPVVVGVVGVGVYLAAALSLVAPLGMPGLALANAAQNSAHAVILYVLLARGFPRLREAAVAWFVARIGLGGAAAALAAWLILGGFGDAMAPAAGLLVRLVAVAVAAAIGLGVYALVLAVLRVTELREVVGIAGRLLRR